MSVQGPGAPPGVGPGPLAVPADQVPPRAEVADVRDKRWIWDGQSWRSALITGRWRAPNGRWAARLCSAAWGPEFPGELWWWDTIESIPFAGA